MTQVQKPHSLQGSEKFEAYPIHLSQQSLVHVVHVHGTPQSNYRTYAPFHTRLTASSPWKLCCSVHRQPMSGVNSWTHQVGLSRTRPDKIVLIIQVRSIMHSLQASAKSSSWVLTKYIVLEHPPCEQDQFMCKADQPATSVHCGSES